MIVLVCEKLFECAIDSSDFYFLNLGQLVQREQQKRAQKTTQNVSERIIGERKALSIFHNIAKAVYHLHENDIVHRNLTVNLYSFVLRAIDRFIFKLENIVYDSRSESIKISKFTFGMKVSSETQLLSDQSALIGHVSERYLSPDILSKQPYLPKPTDCWAMGVILYFLFYSTFPFTADCKKVGNKTFF